MRKFILYALCFAAELSAARIKYERDLADGKESGGFSYRDIARSASDASDSALLWWRRKAEL